MLMFPFNSLGQRQQLRRGVATSAVALLLAAVAVPGDALERTAVGSKDISAVRSFGLQMDAMKAANESVINALMDRLALAEGRISTLEVTAENLDGRMTLAEAEIVDLKVQLRSLEARMTAAEADISTLKAQLTSVLARIGNIEAYLDTLTRRVALLEGDMADAKQKITALMTELTSLKSRVAALEAKIGVRELPPASKCGGHEPISNGSVWGCSITVTASNTSCNGGRCSQLGQTANKICQMQGYSYATAVTSLYGEGCKSCNNYQWSGSAWVRHPETNMAMIGGVSCFINP